MPAVGDKLANKYRLVRTIGEGGMGVVFEAEHEELGKQVAIKLLHPEFGRDKSFAARFKREARAAAATGHPSIIDIYDFGQTDDGTLFLVMELLRGESLADTLEREGPLDIPTTTYIICEVLAALQDAHRATIIHRDIKPDNIFLVRNGKRLPDVKLLDFGASRFIDPADPVRRLTRSGIIMGTPHYLAPEQVEGKTRLDLRVDLYAAGVVLYESLTGELPFTGDTVLAIFRKIDHGQFVPLRELVPKIPEELEAVILKAMARDRKKRFNSAGAMREALLPFLDEGMSGPISRPRKSLPRPSAGRSAWFGLVIVLLLTIGGFGFDQVWSFGDEAEDTAFEQPDASLAGSSLKGTEIRPSTPSPSRRSKVQTPPQSRRRERTGIRREAPVEPDGGLSRIKATRKKTSSNVDEKSPQVDGRPPQSTLERPADRRSTKIPGRWIVTDIDLRRPSNSAKAPQAVRDGSRREPRRIVTDIDVKRPR